MNQRLFRNGSDVGKIERVVLEKLDFKHPSASLIIYTKNDKFTYRYMETYCNKNIDGVKVTLSDVLSLDDNEVNVHLTEYIPNDEISPYMEMLSIEIENGSFNGWKFIFELDITDELKSNIR